jgi:hypothetical protein
VIVVFPNGTALSGRCTRPLERPGEPAINGLREHRSGFFIAWRSTRG